MGEDVLKVTQLASTRFIVCFIFVFHSILEATVFRPHSFSVKRESRNRLDLAYVNTSYHINMNIQSDGFGEFWFWKTIGPTDFQHCMDSTPLKSIGHTHIDR